MILCRTYLVVQKDAFHCRSSGFIQFHFLCNFLLQCFCGFHKWFCLADASALSLFCSNVSDSIPLSISCCWLNSESLLSSAKFLSFRAWLRWHIFILKSFSLIAPLNALALSFAFVYLTSDIILAFLASFSGSDSTSTSSSMKPLNASKMLLTVLISKCWGKYIY